MDADAQVFGHEDSAPGAHLRGVLGRDFDDLAGNSFFRFLPENREEPEPRHIPHGFVKRSPTIPRFHLFDINNVIAFEQTVGSLKMEVPTLISDLGVGTGDKNLGLVPTARTLLPPIFPTLAHSKLALGLFEESGVVDDLSVAGGKERFASHIDAGLPARWWHGSGRNIIAGKGNKPLASRGSADSYGLYFSFDGAGEADCESAYLLDNQMFAVELPSCLFEGKGIVAIPAPKPRQSWPIVSQFPLLYSSKETFVGRIQSFKDILENLRTDLTELGEFCLQSRKFFHLGIFIDGYSVLPVGGDPLLESSVIQSTAKLKPLFGSPNSLRIALNRISEGLFHDPCTNPKFAYYLRKIKCLMAI
jgi:hypothetical protein